MDSVSTDHRFLANMNCENINPDMVTDGKICNQIGFQYYENGDFANAIGYYKKAIALSPEYPVPLNNLGVVYLKSNKLELARECFSKAIVLNPEYVKAICNLAVVSYKVGDLEAARQLYQKAKRVDGSYVKQRIDNYINHNQ
ncbi:MAG: tetratricopeptide repeat protein [Deltaproteobacteria bacterium]|nr:tetratricopeptide repeat protein [Deltaproteobacteria bacterium]